MSTCRRLKVDRERVVKSVDYMAERGWLEVRTADLVHGYRWIKRIGDPKTLSDRLFQGLVERERNEIARVEQVMKLAEAISRLPQDQSIP